MSHTGETVGSPRITAALTLSLTGPYARQGTDAAEGVRLWAEAAGIRLTLVDDRGSKTAAVQAYAAWLNDSVDLLLGPYASGLTRAVAPLAREAGRLLWNHGGSADDLMQQGVATLLTPASAYFDGAVSEAAARRVNRMLVVQGAGPFARAVAGGAAARAAERGLDVRMVDADALPGEDAAGVAVLTAGRFEHDADVVQRLRAWRHPPALVGAVAAGIPAFWRELGEAAKGVLGPAHWWPNARKPEIGPSGMEFADDFRRRAGREPAYVAAQAAAAGYLADAAYRLGLSSDDVLRWKTSTLLGDFALDADWRQVGHRMTTIQWHDGRMIPIASS